MIQFKSYNVDIIKLNCVQFSVCDHISQFCIMISHSLPNITNVNVYEQQQIAVVVVVSRYAIY